MFCQSALPQVSKEEETLSLFAVCLFYLILIYILHPKGEWSLYETKMGASEKEIQDRHINEMKTHRFYFFTTKKGNKSDDNLH